MAARDMLDGNLDKDRAAKHYAEMSVEAHEWRVGHDLKEGVITAEQALEQVFVSNMGYTAIKPSVLATVEAHVPRFDDDWVPEGIPLDKE